MSMRRRHLPLVDRHQNERGAILQGFLGVRPCRRLPSAQGLGAFQGRLSHSVRCQASHPCTSTKGAGARWQVRTRPFLMDRTIPLSSSTLRCRMNVGRAILCGACSALTVAGPLARCSITARRVGSDMAPKKRSSLLVMWLSLELAGRRCNPVLCRVCHQLPCAYVK